MQGLCAGDGWQERVETSSIVSDGSLAQSNRMPQYTLTLYESICIQLYIWIIQTQVQIKISLLSAASSDWYKFAVLSERMQCVHTVQGTSCVRKLAFGLKVEKCKPRLVWNGLDGSNSIFHGKL
eukprot:TRINITY_DN13529_c0_g1_i1.p2 TRINITY_DN13529_c0_g1~~TRINITY_DN13529_c0_g1_i1.p2  ORF type:complete len:124 (+),score=1.60 TRINITY_DN13529_c0_g1_i1:658-1029(+)